MELNLSRDYQKAISEVPIFLVDRFPTWYERNMHEYDVKFFKKQAKRISLESLPSIQKSQNYGVQCKLSGFNSSMFSREQSCSFSAESNQKTIEMVKNVIIRFVSEEYYPNDFSSKVLISPYTSIIMTQEEREAKEIIDRIGRNMDEYIFIQQRRFGII